jgi:vacuolar iron transporter family protein
MASRQEIKRYCANLADVRHSAALYETLAHVEKDISRKLVFEEYAGNPDTAKMSEDEHRHASVVQALATAGKPEATMGAEIAEADSWHRGVSFGNDLRAAVLGANDGLVLNFCLIMGVAGAGTGNKTILLTALAGLIAGACTKALGEWLSVTNARELAQTQIAREAYELEHTPDAEEHELALIYRAKGLDGDETKRVASQLMRDRDNALDALTREDVGLDPAELDGNPWSAAAESFFLFATGAIFPAMPFLWTSGATAIVQCIVLSILALAAIGVFTSPFNGQSAAFCAVRQVIIGLAAAAFTFDIGHILDVSVS